MANKIIFLSTIALLGHFVCANTTAPLEQSSNSSPKKYFLITLEKLTWIKALQHCRSLDMNLASMDTQEEHDLLMEQIVNEGHADKLFHIRNISEINGTLKLSNKNKLISYTNWTEPNGNVRELSEFERRYRRRFIERGFLPNNVESKPEHHFICEKKQVQISNAVADQSNAVQKKYYPITLKRVPWTEAWKHCKSIDMQLASIESQNEQDYLIHEILKNGIDEWLWTSGMIVDNNRTFKWIGNDKPVTYTNWNNGEPNNQNGNEKCVNLYFSWNDNNCNEAMYFICERNHIQ